MFDNPVDKIRSIYKWIKRELNSLQFVDWYLDSYKMKYFAVALLVIISTNSAFGFSGPCRTGGNEPVTVQSAACDATTCLATRGSSLNAVAEIRATAAHASLSATYHAYILGFWSDISGGQDLSRVCFEIGDNVGQNSCPLTAGQVFRWNIVVSLILDFCITSIIDLNMCPKHFLRSMSQPAFQLLPAFLLEVRRTLKLVYL